MFQKLTGLLVIRPNIGQSINGLIRATGQGKRIGALRHGGGGCTPYGDERSVLDLLQGQKEKISNYSGLYGQCHIDLEIELYDLSSWSLNSLYACIMFVSMFILYFAFLQFEMSGYVWYVLFIKLMVQWDLSKLNFMPIPWNYRFSTIEMVIVW